ncbi:EboA domain-containing protein [Arcicella aquatica]|uniref:EboA domain-containing protein n=1 Tax=Arcicella aquatica TaxID=217141 RepID=A0ABU5QTT2_9BACT|nr:EboA domain-containing protein [Arcicella aquatica]MEA5260521.1 EboA domain-containing protein [Arcicella aquatica]
MSIQSNLLKIIQENATEKELNWILSKTSGDSKHILTAFVATPRFVSKKTVTILVDNENLVHEWTMDRLTRVHLLLSIPHDSEETYLKNINSLFDTAEINEAVALYSALPYLAFPQKWVYRATEAVRSNIGLIFDSLAFRNTFASTYFSEAEWNQLVLKCIFNDKPIHLIHGLTERANQKLADTLSDFAHERWAAGRTVPAQVWRLVIQFLNESLLKDIEKLLLTDSQQNQIAAILVCKETTFEPAKSLLEKYSTLVEGLDSQRIYWKTLEE